MTHSLPTRLSSDLPSRRSACVIRLPRAAEAAAGAAAGQGCDGAIVEAASGGHRHAAAATAGRAPGLLRRSEEHTSELQSLMRLSYAVFCLKKKTHLKYMPQSHKHTHITTSQ